MIYALLVFAAFVASFLLVACVPLWRWFLLVSAGCAGILAWLFRLHHARATTADPLARMMDAALLDICVIALLLAMSLQIPRAWARRRNGTGYRHWLVVLMGAASLLIVGVLYI